MGNTVLIIDDDVTNIKTAQDILQDEYKVATATSGKVAFKILEKMTPDLILLDINMPEMDGFEVLEELKKKKETRKIPVIFLTAEQSAEVENRALAAGAKDFVAKPFNPSVLKNRMKNSIEMQMYQRHLENMVAAQTEAIMKHENQINRIQQEMINAMANIIESRDGSTGEHVKRTSRYVALLVEVLQKDDYVKRELTEYYAELLCRAAYMHDIGKIKVDDAILRKPGRFTEEEYAKMKAHAPAGGEIIRMTMKKIEDRDYVDIACDVATHHHERWDGKGYPEGLSGEEIPLGARIMALADVFDALTSVRCYKEAMDVERAFSIIEEEAGKQFDPDLARVMLANKDVFRNQLEEFVTEE
ncbi:MAG: response regulator [Clostridiales bacterium]|nr:response regulator [Clostridiales bacterium]